MTLTPITLDATPDMTDITAALVELQGLKVAVVAGTTSATNIPITGIATNDTIVSVVLIAFVAGTPSLTITDVTSQASITSAGNIQLSTTNTTGDTLLVHWFDKS